MKCLMHSIIIYKIITATNSNPVNYPFEINVKKTKATNKNVYFPFRNFMDCQATRNGPVSGIKVETLVQI